MGRKSSLLAAWNPSGLGTIPCDHNLAPPSKWPFVTSSKTHEVGLKSTTRGRRAGLADRVLEALEKGAMHGKLLNKLRVSSRYHATSQLMIGVAA